MNPAKGQEKRHQGENRPGVSMDEILAQWRRERPDIDPSPMGVCGELWRAGERLRQGVQANLADHNLDLAGFDVLLTLLRQGGGKVLSPSALAKEMMLSTSAMTNRLDRLETRGLITRSTHPNDRRAIQIALSDDGRALAGRIIASHVETEERLIAALTKAERRQLRQLVSKIAQG